MIDYLRDQRITADEQLKSTEIETMHDIIFGTAAERRRRLPEGATDCFGCFDKDRMSECSLPDGQFCYEMSACQTVTALQIKSRTLAEKRASKPQRKQVAVKERHGDYLVFRAKSLVGRLCQIILDENAGDLRKAFVQAQDDLGRSEKEVRAIWSRAKRTLKQRGFQVEEDDGLVRILGTDHPAT